MLDWLFKFAPFAELQLNGFIYFSFYLFPPLQLRQYDYYDDDDW